MQTLEWTTIDKSDWPVRGEWDGEPDKKQFRDAATGLPCLALRGLGGHWCGYVGVSKDHPWHGKDYDTCVRPENHEDYEGDGYHYSCTLRGVIEIHGGITFADGCEHSEDPSSGICHVSAPGEPDDVWWFGFDCAHLGDLSPRYNNDGIRFGEIETYKPLSYIEAECARLADQLATVA